jgi:serine protease Do
MADELTSAKDPIETKSVSSRRSTSAPPKPPRNTAQAERAAKTRFQSLLIAFGFMVSLAAGFFGGMLGAARYEDTGFNGKTTVASQQRLAASESQLYADIAQKVGPSVVSIDVVSQAEPTVTDFWGFSVPSRPQGGSGTGIVISSDGLIVTNRHVVPTDTADVTVTLSDGTQLDEVEIVGRTSQNDSLDVAFLRINDLKGKKLTPAEIGDSSKVKVGDIVVAIGNALGQFNNTVTSGIISGYGRNVQAGDSSGTSVENLNDLFQTDAAINQGNSGGPLVNSLGQVIGINTAVSGQGQNIGFAIPINDVNGLIKQVLEDGKFERPYLGVRYIPLDAASAKELELKVTSGAYVPEASEGQPSILEGSPAQKAGIREKDVITQVEGTKIDGAHSLSSLISRRSVGDKVKLTVIRDGKTITLTATVGAMPEAP